MKKRGMVLDDILEPVFDALNAKMIVKSQHLGDAQEVNLLDHQIRMQASDRLVELYGAWTKEKTNTSGQPTLEELVLASMELERKENEAR